MTEKESYIKQHNNIHRKFTNNSSNNAIFELHQRKYNTSDKKNIILQHNDIMQIIEECNNNYKDIIDKAAADIAQKINEHLEQLQK